MRFLIRGAFAPLGHRKALDAKAVKDAAGKAKPAPLLRWEPMLHIIFAAHSNFLETLEFQDVEGNWLPTHPTGALNFNMIFTGNNNLTLWRDGFTKMQVALFSGPRL